MLHGNALALWGLWISAVSAGVLVRKGGPLVDQSFDYVVVGGGTAGNVVATRLAQRSFRVALVEAGAYYELDSLAEVPAADVIPVGSDPATPSAVDWGFVAYKQPGANGRDVHYARGKCLGGSPTKESMDQWANAVNDQSYTFDETLPYYKRSVKFSPPDTSKRAPNATAEYNAAAFDSNGGPLDVSYSFYAQPFSSWMKIGMEAIGISETEDFNSGTLMGGQYCSSTIDPSNEFRSSSESSFLKKVSVPSLTIYTSTLATKILFDKDKTATGVQVKGPLGNVVTLSASKEVIVSAGTFQSPQLLMVSGIGPSEILDEHQIDPVAILPGVGQNMQDHPFLALSYRVNVVTLTSFARNLVFAAGQLLDGVIAKNGMLVNPIADYLAWEKIPQRLRSHWSQSTQEALAKYPGDWPEVEYVSGAGYIGDFSNLLVNQPSDGYNYASILGVLIAPLSRGSVSLQSSDTSDLPIINPNWLDHPADQEVAISMFKRIREAFQSDAMKPIVIGEEYFPGMQVQSDTDILQWIKNNMMTLWHASCTCKMGTSKDAMAVIDSRARVFGVQKLRVVDASSFPFLPPGHPQSTVYMLAEKIADDIIHNS
ncbi:hypothetical protein N7468_003874 [Penicillium chermesinum]|uniref:Glucose-methanol-choline oxidoreductase N-terminal domain-containing protein n=1 Tax=Penicillium chermesinum TaxID=63820 RepID=A0A9W9P7G2_9EURO|nr:uncharacterized protein N7468_003874 [Penicillium chermesinum]KAJ5239255.1 hypothetical protein N7468_003874 [Penicillium chermesinum]KAJ6164886.1 hypothetical protein N7470_003558 [Penicillium chermesinum]